MLLFDWISIVLNIYLQYNQCLAMEICRPIYAVRSLLVQNWRRAARSGMDKGYFNISRIQQTSAWNWTDLCISYGNQWCLAQYPTNRSDIVGSWIGSVETRLDLTLYVQNTNSIRKTSSYPSLLYGILFPKQ